MGGGRGRGEEEGEESSNYLPVLALSKTPNGAINFINASILEGLADTSTIQLFVDISRTLPPNWCVRRSIARKCSCLCRKASLGASPLGW